MNVFMYEWGSAYEINNNELQDGRFCNIDCWDV